MINKGLFTSNTDLWATPKDFFDELDKTYKFTLDVCATAENAKCAKFFTEEDDGLAQEWVGRIWMNPPYGRDIGKWMAKAREAGRVPGNTVVCLVPARTDTAWWHDYAMYGRVVFIRGRLKFGDSKNSAPFPSALVVYGEAVKRGCGQV
jgi:phage N-6-adenine-methyltransferase